MDIQWYGYISTNEHIYWGYILKLLSWTDGLETATLNSCPAMGGNSDPPPLGCLPRRHIWPSTSLPCPNPSGYSSNLRRVFIDNMKGVSQRRNPHLDWSPLVDKKLSMSMECTCPPPLLPKKRDYGFATGETERRHMSLGSPLVSGGMARVPSSFWPDFKVLHEDDNAELENLF